MTTHTKPRRGCAECRRLRKERARHKAEVDRLRKLVRSRVFAAIARIDRAVGQQTEVENG